MFGFQLACGAVGAVCIGFGIGGPLGFLVGSALFALAATGAIVMDAIDEAEELEDDEL